MYDREKEARETLYEIEELIRTRPPKSTIRHDSDENIEWLGRAQAVVRRWDQAKSISFEMDVKSIHSPIGQGSVGYLNVLILLNMARYDLKMFVEPTTDIVVEAGKTYQYFEHIRRFIELSTSEIFFIDPYINADFVSRYLIHVKEGVKIKILTKEYLSKLVPAIQVFSEERKIQVEVRSATELHDRYLITDKKNCYQSGTSFKDGAKNAPTTLVEIHDAFKAVLQTYEAIWDKSEKC
jgi:hypothetical protein